MLAPPLLLRRLVRERQLDVAGLLQNLERAANRPRHVAAQRGALVDHQLLHREPVDVQRLVLRRSLGVGHCAPQQLGQRFRRALFHVSELRERRVDVLAADEVRHHPHLARGDAEIAEGCSGFHVVSSPLLLRRRGRSGWGGGSRSAGGRARGAGLDRLLVAGVSVEGAGGGELAQLVPHHVLGDEHRDELAPVVHRERVPHQVGKDGRAARPRLHHLLLVLPVHVLHLLDQVAVDERALLDRTCHQRTPLSRRLMMNLVVRLLTRVLYPLVGWPQGETGCGLPWPLLPSPPPCGWSTGFIARPRTVGRQPFQRFRPALPMRTISCSVLPSWPTVALHSSRTLRTSVEGMRICAYLPSFAISWPKEPAERIICAPCPFFNSMLWITVPSGIACSGSEFPGRMSTASPDCSTSPTFTPTGQRM